MNPLIELEDVGVGGPGSVLLHPATVSFAEGETTFLLGPSGSGKSTLLKVAAGLFPPSQGEIRVRGQNLATMNARQLADFRLVSAFVFQNSALWQNMTLQQNLTLPLNWNFPGMSKDDMELRVAEALNAVGYHDSTAVRPADLSVGAQKSLGFARALAMDPAIYFMDSPLSLLDGAAANRLIAVMKELKRKGRTLLVIANNLDLAFQMADNLCLFNNGRVEFMGPLADAVAQWPDFLDEIKDSHRRTLAARGIVIDGGSA
jgi:ABC-type transporter Mla maintaining outer membrane lipid asymmetry ATPase subunit MlaF